MDNNITIACKSIMAELKQGQFTKDELESVGLWFHKLTNATDKLLLAMEHPSEESTKENPCDTCLLHDKQYPGENQCSSYVNQQQFNIEEAIRKLQSYQRLEDYGHVGRFLSNEYTEYKETKKFEGEGLMNWCVRLALEALGVKSPEN